MLQPGTPLSATEALVQTVAGNITELLDAHNLAPNLAGSALLTAFMRYAGALEPEQRQHLPAALRTIADNLAIGWLAARQ